jgi:hypothetical protein
MKHILEPIEEEKKLKFIVEIDPADGSHHKPMYQPSDFKNVRHITGNVFYAWDDESTFGCVYIGEYA